MRIFGTGRGCFVAFNVSVAGSRGAILELPGGDSGTTAVPDADSQLGLVVTDVGFSQQEVVNHLRCFNNAIYTYAFGAGVGDCVVKFLGFLNKGTIVAQGEDGGSENVPAGSDGGVFATVLKMYAKARISRSKLYARLVLGQSGDIVSGQVVAMSSATSNTEGNIQDFTLSLKMTSVQQDEETPPSDPAAAESGSPNSSDEQAAVAEDQARRREALVNNARQYNNTMTRWFSNS